MKTLRLLMSGLIRRLKNCRVPDRRSNFSKKTNEIIAEAELTNRIFVGIEIAEVHYKNYQGGTCCVVLSAKRSINRFGHKERENETAGRKQRKYNFTRLLGGR